MKDLAIALENRPGALAEMGEALGRAGVSIEGGGVFEGGAHFLFHDADAACAALHAAGIRVNAGHGLNYQNLSGLFAVPHLVELNIGHSIISRAITIGLALAVKEMLVAMQGYPAAARP